MKLFNYAEWINFLFFIRKALLRTRIFKIITLLIIVFLFKETHASSIADSTLKHNNYSFIIKDSPPVLFTMRQVNQNYLSFYRLFSNKLYSVTNKKSADIIQVLCLSLLFIPLTHEEGHRSVLTAYGIGSVSQPFFNKHGAAYVKGVSNQVLEKLRDNDLPAFIRLHSAGLESDYMLTHRMETIGSFGLDNFESYKWEYWLRKFTILQYYLSGLIKLEINISEEENELDRDIVGFDTYGAAKHLFRPDIEFFRYTKYSDLLGEEKKFIRRMGFRSLFNLVNPLIFGKDNFFNNSNIRLNFGMGYTLSPFGDFIEENFWIAYNSLNINLYAKQFQNKKYWYCGYGIRLVNFNLGSKFAMDLAIHYWEQPENLDFNSSNSFYGGAIDIDFRYFVPLNAIGLKAASLDCGFIMKTKGFLPEEMFSDKHFGIRLGVSIIL